RMPSERDRLMDQDLQELLALWLGHHDPGEARRAALVTRLRDDEPFRRTFVEEIYLLGMLKGVQSSEPRGLRLEDEIGWSAPQPDEIDALAQKVVQEAERQQRKRRFIRWCVATVAAGLAAALLLVLRPGRPLPSIRTDSPPEGVQIATAIRVEDV